MWIGERKGEERDGWLRLLEWRKGEDISMLSRDFKSFLPFF